MYGKKKNKKAVLGELLFLGFGFCIFCENVQNFLLKSVCVFCFAWLGEVVWEKGRGKKLGNKNKEKGVGRVVYFLLLFWDFFLNFL